MPVSAGELRHGLAVPTEFEPPKAVEDRLDVLGLGAFAIGILDAEDELAAGVARIEPVEQRRARAADMQRAGGRRRKACDHRAAIGRCGCAT